MRNLPVVIYFIISLCLVAGASQFKQIMPGIGVGNLASDPASPNKGDFYFNTSTNTLKVYNGSAWLQINALAGAIWPIVNGGTNSSTALNNNRFMISSGGAIVENAAVTASRALASTAGGLPVASATTATELGYVNGVTSAIQTQLGTKVDTIGAFGAAPANNAATISGTTLTFQPADATHPGSMTTGSQTFAGAKTFSSAPVLSALTASQAVVTDGSKNLASLQYTNANTASTIVSRDGSGNFSAGTITAALTGNASTATSATSATTATNATNVATTAVSTNASWFPLFVTSSSNGNQPASLGTGLTFNPSTNTLTTTTFSGALSGTATNATNAATVSVSSNASYFPLMVASSSNGNQAHNLGTGLTFNPSTNTLATTTFSGALSGNASTVTTNANLTGDVTSVGNATSYSAVVSNTKGGTGQSSAWTADGVIYALSTTVLASTAAGTAGNVMTSNGPGVAPTYQAVASSPTSNYFSGHFGLTATWDLTTAAFGDGSNTNGNTLTTVYSNGLTVTAAASNICGITFTPSASTSVYLITANITFNTQAGGNNSFRLTDGTTVFSISDNSGCCNTTMTGIYAPGTGSAVTVKIQLYSATAGNHVFIENITNAYPVEWMVVQIK